jgi:hypothetical protein
MEDRDIESLRVPATTPGYPTWHCVPKNPDLVAIEEERFLKATLHRAIPIGSLGNEAGAERLPHSSR